MKKFLINFFTILAIIFLGNPSFCQEKFSLDLIKNDNYLILLNEPVSEIMVNNINSIHYEILTTLYNEKNQIMIKPIKEGIFRLYIILENQEYIVLSINSNSKNQDKLNIINSKLIKTILKIDTIDPLKKEPEFKLDEPPILKPKLRGKK